MKRSILILIGVSVLLMHACSTNVTEQSEICIKPGDLLTITAYSDNAAQTKTSLVDNGNGGKAVEWKTGNSISLFFNQGTNGGDKFTTATNGPIAEFSGKISAVSGSLSGVGGKAYFWGVYPYNALNSCDGTSITTSLSASQKAYAGDVADNLLVTIGRSENLSIYFKNTCAVIGFKLSQENIKKVVFSGRANEAVAGEFKVSFDSGNNLVVEPTANAVTSISVTPAESSTFTPGTTYYFATLPDTFSEGYTLTFIRDDDAEATYERTTSFTFSISTFYTMTNKDSGLTFSEPTPSAENIVFADDKIKAKLVAAFDTNDDGEISYAEAAAVTSIEGVFGAIKTYKKFDEFQFFTGVTEVPDNLFADCQLQSIVLPESIITIGSSSFQNCNSLSLINLPDGVTYIGNNAFSGCNILTSINIPENLTYLGKSAFSGCSSLVSPLIIPGGVTGIGESSFSGCSSIEIITIPESVTSIGAAAFSGCSRLTSVVIPESVTSIGVSAFSGCSGLTSITIPDSVTSIGGDAFSGCSGMTSITIPASVTSIGHCAFEGCSGLMSITIPESVTSIGNSAFSGCSGLTSITIPDSVTSIGESAFSKCSGLASVTIPESVTSIENYAFLDCNGLTSVTVLCTTPPTMKRALTFTFEGSYPIYVPAESVGTYKSAMGWSRYASRIQAIPIFL